MPAVTVGLTPVDIVGRNCKRQGISFKNTSTGGQIIYLARWYASGLIIANAEYPLNPGDGLNFVVPFDGTDTYREWSAVASAAGGTLYWSEEADR
jgi:hypothetical protein